MEGEAGQQAAGAPGEIATKIKTREGVENKMTDNSGAVLLSICILSILIWVFFKAVNNFEKKIGIEVFDLPAHFLSLTPWKKLILTVSVFFVIYLYFYCDRKILNIHGTGEGSVNIALRKGWTIKESYQDHETVYFLLERNLINKWLYE